MAILRELCEGGLTVLFEYADGARQTCAVSRMAYLQVDAKAAGLAEGRACIMWHPFLVESPSGNTQVRVWLHWEWPAGVLADQINLAKQGAREAGTVHCQEFVKILMDHALTDPSDPLIRYAVPYDVNNMPGLNSKKQAYMLKYGRVEGVQTRFAENRAREARAVRGEASLLVRAQRPEAYACKALPIALHRVPRLDASNATASLITMTVYRTVDPSSDTTFGDFLTKQSLMQLAPDDIKTRVLVQGIVIEPETPLVELYHLMHHPDEFLHICVLQSASS